MNPTYFFHALDHAQPRTDKPHKHTFFAGERLLVGLNTLQTGRRQALHDHADQDKFYFVLAGQGEFTVGAETQTCGPGDLILAPAGIPHGVENHADPALTFLTVIAPWPAGA